VAEAIDRLDADRKSADPAQLEARVAAIWAMVSGIDPELARLVAGYAGPGGAAAAYPVLPVEPPVPGPTVVRPAQGIPAEDTGSAEEWAPETAPKSTSGPDLPRESSPRPHT
jgi:hypothetical protein